MACFVLEELTPVALEEFLEAMGAEEVIGMVVVYDTFDELNVVGNFHVISRLADANDELARFRVPDSIVIQFVILSAILTGSDRTQGPPLPDDLAEYFSQM